MVSYQALMTAAGPQATVLLGLTREGDQPWRVEFADDSAVQPGQEHSLTFGKDTCSWNRYSFALVLPQEDGGMRVYRIVRENWDALWCVQALEQTDASGVGYRVYNDRVWMKWKLNALPDGGMEYLEQPVLASYPYHAMLWLGYAPLGDYPKTELEAAAQARQSVEATPKGYVVIGSVNFRQKATTSSKKLGRVQNGTLGKVLDTKGSMVNFDGEPRAEWYHVAIGSAQGYVYGQYCYPTEEAGLCRPNWYTPIPLAVTLAECPLRAEPRKGAESVMLLPAGQKLQVMVEADDGWLHVMAPATQRPGGFVDLEGTDGYLRLEEVALNRKLSAN